MNNVKKIMAVLLIFILTAGAAACGSGTSWVYESDGRQITAGLYINFLMTALSELEAAELDAHATDPDYQITDMRAFLKTTNEDGVTVSDQAKAEAAKMAGEYFAVEKLFGEMNLTLGQEDSDHIGSYVDYIWPTSGEQLESNGVARESVLLYQTNLLKKDIIFATLYDKGGERAVPEEALRAEFAKRYARIEVMYVSVPATNGEEDAAEKLKAEDYFARYKAGEAIEDLDFEYRQSIADEETRDSVTKAEAGAMIRILEVDEPEEGDVLLPAITGARTGDVVMVEHSAVYYIFKKLDLMENPEDYESYREGLLYEMKTDEFLAYLRELADSLAVNANQSSLKRYTPEKIKVQEA